MKPPRRALSHNKSRARLKHPAHGRSYGEAAAKISGLIAGQLRIQNIMKLHSHNKLDYSQAAIRPERTRLALQWEEVGRS